MNDSTTEHIAVLVKTLAEQIDLPPDAVMVDATVGHGGHSLLFGQPLGPEGVIIGLDLDGRSIRKAQFKLKDLACKVFLVCSNFSEIRKIVNQQGIGEVDFILADLGVCSAQLTDSEMGLSFQQNMLLDMRIDKTLKTTAADIVNDSDEKTLADLIFKFGQDRASRRIARFIVKYRQAKRISTTIELAGVVSRALGQTGPRRKSRIHPATRTFQALRIAVNSELENLEKLLAEAPQLLKKNGYIAVISFHSLEDKLVKVSFKENKARGIYRIITKKPIVPVSEEIADNPRARSAKLRIAQRQ